jgi:uncharacterized protein (TIGR00288 family)
MSSTPVVHAPHAALLIDFDNVTLGIRSDLTKELRTLLNSDIIRGKVAVQRAYADWRRYPQYIVPLSESSIDLIFAPAFGTNKKNATDIRLAVDAIELVFTRPEIGTFILLSGDSDFSSLVIKLKEYGKYIIGVGIRESASDLLIQNCDEYYSYTDLAGLTKEEDTPSIQRDPWELAGEAVAQMHRSGDVMRSDRLKQVMQQLDPNFDERNAGFNRFSKFVTEAGNRGLITVSKLDNGQYEVGPIAGGKSGPAKVAAKVERGGRPERGRPAEKPSQPAAAPAVEMSEEPGRRRRRSRGRGRDRDREEGKQAPAAKSESTPEARSEPRRAAAKADAVLTLAEAFQLLQSALNELPQPVAHDKVRARMLALLGREDGLMEADRFARFLRQANDAEVADVRKIDDEHYEVLPHRAQLALQARDQMSARAKGGSAAESTTASAEASSSAGPAEPRSVATLRFRRGSRGPLRPSDIPLTGAVKIGGSTPDVPVGAKAIVPAKPAAPVKPAAPANADSKPAAVEAPKKVAKKRGSRKKAAPRKAASTA